MTDQAGANPIEYVIRRLNAARTISLAAEEALSGAVSFRPTQPDHVEVDVDSCAAFLARGLACRFRLLADGRRQLTGFLIAGDLCDHGFLSGCKPVTRILTLTRCVIAEVRMPRFVALCEEHPDLLSALMRSTALDSAVTEEHVVSLGLRTAAERLGHLICEMHQRLDAVGLVDDEAFDFRVTQAELADGLGMSAVHVNRTLQRLRRQRFVAARGGRISIMDGAGLRKMAGYDPAYLH